MESRKSEWKEKYLWVHSHGDQSSLILLYGVATIYITLMFIVVWREAALINQKCLQNQKAPEHPLKKTSRVSFDQNLHKLLLAAPIMGVLDLYDPSTDLLIYFHGITNYSKVNDHLVLFDCWLLFCKNLNLNDSIGKQFYSSNWHGRPASWFCNSIKLYFRYDPTVINRKETHFMWFLTLALSIAAPQFVSLIMRSMLQPTGIVNTLLLKYGLIDTVSIFLKCDAGQSDSYRYQPVGRYPIYVTRCILQHSGWIICKGAEDWWS